MARCKAGKGKAAASNRARQARYVKAHGETHKARVKRYQKANPAKTKAAKQGGGNGGKRGRPREC